MFDDGILLLIKDSLIDKARNAITLSINIHRRFGNFEVYFEPTSENLHTYWIQSTEDAVFQKPMIFPVTRALYLATSRPIDPPSERFLAVHRAITLILHLSTAGEYIDKILRDLEETDVKEDGSTELGRLVELKYLSSWNNGVCAY
jgi:HNH endonuclease